MGLKDMELKAEKIKIFNQGKIETVSDLVIPIKNIKKNKQLLLKADRDWLLFPGLIDPHVHVRDFEQSHKEDFLSVSQAAAAGGYVYFIDMPNSQPPVVDLKTLSKRVKAANLSCLECGFHFGASSQDNLEAILEAAKNNKVHSVKLYLNHTTGDLLIENQKLLEKYFRNIDLISVHAEQEKIDLVIKLAKKYGTKLYLCHVRGREELEKIRPYKLKYPNRFFIEVTLHHLFLTKQADDDAFKMMKPSLGGKDDQAALWQGIKQGVVDTIGTDHAPHLIKEKKSKEPPFGVPGIETSMALMMQAYLEKNITLQQIFYLMVKNPAQIFKIGENYNYCYNPNQIKTKLRDFVIVDLSSKHTLKQRGIKSKAKWSPFEDWSLIGWPKITVAGGRLVYSDYNQNMID
ncbi:MAG: amidohydrolase family protein [Candidatus Moranbacteria bacterium]|nr:amidohydrolase family protein [Candidatus Moranbacteria bacterium]